MGLTGCDHRHQSLVTGCASEDTEVDSLGSEEDSEPLELYSGDVSRAGRLRRLTALDTSPEYSSGGSSSSSSPSSSTSLSSEAHPVTRDWCRWSHPVRHTMETNYRRGAQLGNMSAINKYIRNQRIITLKKIHSNGVIIIYFREQQKFFFRYKYLTRSDLITQTVVISVTRHSFRPG